MQGFYTHEVFHDEILKIEVCDVKILVDHMLVSVPARKNDQYRQGHILPVI